MPIVLDGTQGISTPMYAGSISSNAVTPVIGMKNKIINGACVIDQRNAGASVTPANGAVTYTLDRWAFYVNQASKLTTQQSSVAPTGFTNSILVTSSSSYSVGSGDVFVFFQPIEGFNTADLGFGTANAKTITVSFWVRSSLTGNFGGVIANNGNTRAYPFTFTINTANTFEYKTITIPGDTSGTWLGATNGLGLNLKISLGAGSTFSGTAGAWASGDITQPTGSVSLVGTNGATFYLTGVQLEVGTQATTFTTAGGSYGAELALCQRYYESCSGMVHYAFMATSAATSIFKYSNLQWIVSKRAAPTVVLTGSGTNASGFTANSPTVNQTGWYCQQTTSGSDAFLTAYTASAEL